MSRKDQQRSAALVNYNQRKEGSTSFIRSNNTPFLVSTLLFLTIAAAISVHCYRASILGIDVLGYAGTVALFDTNNVVKVHDMVYSGPLTPHLRGLDDDGRLALDMRRRASDPYYSAMHIPYFAIKPVYVLAVGGVHKLGFNVIDSVRATSALFFFGIAVVLWMYTRSWLAVLILLLPEILLLGQTHDPDGMSCFLLLLGLWTVFMKQMDIGLLPLLVAIWVRPENALLCGIVILVMLLHGRLNWEQAAILLLLSLGSDIVINRYGYPWEELYGHFLGATAGAGAASPFSNYVHALLTSLNSAGHSAVPLYCLLWLVCFPMMGKEFRWIMGITAAFSAIRFVMFPGYEARYYGLLFLTTSMAPVLLVQNGIYQRLARPKLPV